jgi:hypothetical protein
MTADEVAALDFVLSEFLTMYHDAPVGDFDALGMSRFAHAQAVLDRLRGVAPLVVD